MKALSMTSKPVISNIEECISDVLVSNVPQERLLHHLARAVRDASFELGRTIFEGCVPRLKIDNFWIYYEAARIYNALCRYEACYLVSLQALQLRGRASRHAFLPFKFAAQFLIDNGRLPEAFTLVRAQLHETPELPIFDPRKLKEIFGTIISLGEIERYSGTSVNDPISVDALVVDSTTTERPMFRVIGGDTPASLSSIEGRRDLPKITIQKFCSQMILVDDGFLTTSDIECGVINTSASTTQYPGAVLEVWLADRMSSEEFPVSQVETALIISDKFPGLNICHFLLDHLTRLALYERVDLAWSETTIIGPPIGLEYQRYVLKQLRIKNYLSTSGFKRLMVSNLYVSSNCSNLVHPAHVGASWALNFLWSHLGRGTGGTRRLYVSRSDAPGRRLRNEEEVFDQLAKLGFERLQLTDLAPDVQIEAFQNATHVIGVHGAGLTNALFCPAGTRIVEIFHPLYATASYASLAHTANWRYIAVIGRDAESHDDVFNISQPEIDPVNYINRDVVVDVSLILRALEVSDGDV